MVWAAFIIYILMCYSQEPNQFQVRPSYTKIGHRKITEQKEE